MNLSVTREACCSQDDQIGPLVKTFDLASDASIQDVARVVGESQFLQFSAPRIVIEAYSDGKLLFNIPAVGKNRNMVEYFVEKNESASSFIINSKLDFIWPENL